MTMTKVNKKIELIVLNAINVYDLKLRNCILYSQEKEIKMDVLLDDIYLNIGTYLFSQRELIEQNLRFVLGVHERNHKRTKNPFKNIS